MIDIPSKELWNERQAFCRRQFDPDVRFEGKWAGFSTSEHATALLMDLETAFCAGAWLSVLIVSLSVVEAHQREVELPPSYPRSFKAVSESFDDQQMTEETEWLRKRRNELVHFGGQAAVSVDDCWADERLEQDARRAAVLVGKVLYDRPLV